MTDDEKKEGLMDRIREFTDEEICKCEGVDFDNR
jgi:hypothetical protein